MTTIGSTLYRFEDGPRIFERPHGYDIWLWEVIGETPCFWLIDCRGTERRPSYSIMRNMRNMAKKAKRPFAYPTVEEAANSYAMRKARQWEHAERSRKAADALFALVVHEYKIDLKHPQYWEES